MPKQKVIALCILLGLFLYACIILILSTGTYDTGDGVTHYLISRFSWQHHHLFIDDWGKPFFTMVSSPFSQFGIKGITFFNILCGLGASYLAYRIAEKLAIPYPFLAMIFTFSAPIYLSVVNSGLTEPLFSFMLILCVWLCMNKRYFMSAIVFSFLPFVRAEFIFVLPLFLLYYVLRKKFLAILLLPVGTIIISTIGYFYYKNFLWLISENPYSETNSHAYGDVKGDLGWYIRDYHHITGLALTLLIVTGSLWFAYKIISKKEDNSKVENNYSLEEMLLVFGSFVLICFAHIVIWARGFYPTLGLLRYMSTFIPLASIVALRGLELINRLPDKYKFPKGKPIVAALFTLGVLIAPYSLRYKIPFQLNPEDVVVKRATDWLKQTPDADKKIYYLSPYITICMNIDPYNPTRRGELWSMNQYRPDQDMEPGSIMIWDSHFGPNEGKIKLDTLLKNPNLTLLHRFDPDQKLPTLGGVDYGVWIFRKN